MKCLYHPSDTFFFRTKGGLSLSKICFFLFCFVFFFFWGGGGGGRGVARGANIPLPAPLTLPTDNHTCSLPISEAFMIYGNRADISLFIFHLFILTLHSN